MTHAVKGWCPGAYRPMMSGDGLIVRVRPRLGRITRAQVLGLCDVSQRFGSGIIDLTSRANLQLRGIDDDQYDAVLTQLFGLDLLDATPDMEGRRNILTTPDWGADDLTTRLHDALVVRLGEFPNLPAKMGFAIDTGVTPLLTDASADIRLERGTDDALVVRADGLAQGRTVTETTAIDVVLELAQWFHDMASLGIRRMARLVSETAMPGIWCDTPSRPSGVRPVPGRVGANHIYGAPFGSINSAALCSLIKDTNAQALRCTPWRLFVLEDARDCPAHGFITAPGDPLLYAHACPGQPACASATVDTRALARALAPHHPDGLHVSGCAKGCAHPHACDTTFVGHGGVYDLIKQGAPWDAPCQLGLSAQDLMNVKA